MIPFPAAPRRLLYVLFTLSGFSALVYEILWAKRLSLSFGTTMPAVSIVAATFMGGLALGSYALGRLCDRNCNLLRIYALLEGAIAFFALTFVPALTVATDFHIYLERLLPTHPFAVHGLHFIFAALLLLPPAICMGGTFPIMCRLFARKKSGGEIGRLYALNTLGATAGAFCSGYILLPEFGLSATTWLAAAINLGIAAVSLLLSRTPALSTPTDGKEDHAATTFSSQREIPTLVAIACIGAFSLAYEILWTRLLLLFLGSTTFAFSLMLSAFLIGIALGGALYARLVKAGLNEKRLFTLLATGMGLSVLLTAPFYDRLAHLFLQAHRLSGENWWLLALFSFLIIFAVMALPTILSGALLPAAVAILNPGTRRTGEGVGLVVLFNTSGAMLGSLVAGFLLIPGLGMENAFRLVATLNLLLGAGYFLRHHATTRLGPAFLLLPLAGLALALAPYHWDQKLLNSGVYCYAPTYVRFGGINPVLAPERLIKVIEGVETTVAVKEIDRPQSTRFFSVNGKTDGGNGGDMPTQVLIGQIPLLLHPDPRNILVIGLGSGITLGGIKEHPVTHIDCAEISPEVVTASRYFSVENREALNDSRVNLAVEDGRDLLLVRRDNYDVIVSQPSNPWQSGNANLFTADFYRLAAARLNPGGLFGQWVGMYDITPANLRLACNTFAEVFPHTLTFRINADLFLIGSASPIEFDYRSMARRMALPTIAAVLAPYKLVQPGDIIARHFYLSDSALRAFAADAGINSDDHPALEFSFRHNLGGKMFGRLKDENLAALEPFSDNQQVPLINLGASRREAAFALLELQRAYGAIGRHSEADFFRRKHQEYAGGEPESPLHATDFPAQEG